MDFISNTSASPEDDFENMDNLFDITEYEIDPKKIIQQSVNFVAAQIKRDNIKRVRDGMIKVKELEYAQQVAKIKQEANTELQSFKKKNKIEN